MKDPVFVYFDSSQTSVYVTENAYQPGECNGCYQLQYSNDISEVELLNESTNGFKYYCSKNKLFETKDSNSFQYRVLISSITLNEWGTVESYYDSCKAESSHLDPSFASILPEEFYSQVFLTQLSYTIKADLYDKNNYIIGTFTSKVYRKDKARKKRTDCGEPKINELNGGVDGIRNAALKKLRRDLSKVIYRHEYKH